MRPIGATIIQITRKKIHYSIIPKNLSRLRTPGDIAPTPEMGQGFRLGFAVRIAAGHNPLPGSVGTFYWTGAWGTMSPVIVVVTVEHGSIG